MSTTLAPPQSLGDILVVEDNKADRLFLSRVPEKAGYHGRPAEIGKVALRSIRTESPQLILPDLNLSDMTDVDMCRRPKENGATRDVPIVFVSAEHDVGIKVRALEAGNVAHFKKPVEPLEILAKIKVALRMNRLQQKLRSRPEELTARIRAVLDGE